MIWLQKCISIHRETRKSEIDKKGQGQENKRARKRKRKKRESKREESISDGGIIDAIKKEKNRIKQQAKRVGRKGGK